MAFRRKAAAEREDLFTTDKVDLVATVEGVVELHVVVDIAWTGSDAQLLGVGARRSLSSIPTGHSIPTATRRRDHSRSM